MRNLIYIFLTLIIVSCYDQTKPDDFLLPNNNEINEIVQTIIEHDSLPILLNNPDSVPLLVQLRKIIVVKRKAQIIDGVEMPFAPNRNLIDMENLIGKKFGDNRAFSELDSSYILFQNDALKEFKLDESISEKFVTANFEIENAKLKFRRFYDITIPIFSLDNSRAYVQITNNCKSGCGGAYSATLEKRNEKWEIIAHSSLWRN